MRRVRKSMVYLAVAGLAFAAGARADNPYQPIVTRNVFDLNPVQAASPIDTTPPPKITLTGIMTIFGTPQALFTVQGVNRPGRPGKSGSYILSEGQRQDDIEVKHIDEKSGMVTFNNHGSMQEIPLTKAPAITVPTVPIPVMNSRRPSPRFGNRFGRVGGNNYNRTDGNSNLRTIPTRGITSMAPRNTLPPEEQMILIAAQHAEAEKKGDPTAALYPPTPLDTAAGVTPNGTPPPMPGGIPEPPPLPGGQH